MKQMMIELKDKIDNSIAKIGDFNIPLPIMDGKLDRRSTRT